MNFKRIILMSFLIVFITVGFAQTSPKIAFLKSLILPGWGELSNNSKTGYVTLTSELVLLSTHFFYSNEIDLLKEEAYQYAIKFAGINSGEYTDQYWVNLTRYSSSGFEPGGFNSYVYQDALTLYPNDSEMQQQYIDSYKIPDSKSWNWNSKVDRAHFSHIRVDQRSAEDIAKTLVGVITLNHLVSGVNAARVALKLKKVNLKVSLNKDLYPNISYSYHF